jgi:hypothetical protein
MNSLVKHQTDNNAASCDFWDLFRDHRDRFTAILSASAPGGRLCVLGAGNVNDLDLAALLGRYREIHLADLDAGALARGVARQGLAGNSAIRLHGDIDLTGMLDRVAAWSPASEVPDGELVACSERPLEAVLPALPGPFGAAASACLLSQIVNGAVRTLGERHPRFLPAFQALRAGHLRLLAGLVAPGGTGVLVTDFVSSDTFPSLASVPPERLGALAARLIGEGNFFHGVNPGAIASAVRADPLIASQITALESVGPWLWDFGCRTYLACALKFRKTPAT